jgi:hypothetical protein
MHSRHRFLMGLLVCVAGCAQLVDSDAPYTLADSTSSAGGAGGAGGMGGTGGGPVCATDADCPLTGLVCAVGSCVEGVCETRNAATGTPCNLGTSDVCDGLGACVECTVAEHCVGIIEDQCTKRACVDKICQVKYLGTEKPASATLQQPGDCKVVVCDGVGGTKTINDDSDTPSDDNGCTVDSCLNGSKVFKFVDEGTNCGVNSYCNSNGQCVGCLTATNCTGLTDACKMPTCVDGLCGISYVADNTILPMEYQSAEDCKIVVCDGKGNKVTRIDMADIPIDDNLCTRDECLADGTPSNPPEPPYAACGDEGACDGLGTCQKPNGKACNSGSECVSTYCIDAVCCENACNGTCQSCNVSPALAGVCSMAPFGQNDGNATIACTGEESCDGNGNCKKDNGQPCSAASDCVHGVCTDEYCCESACVGTCQACNVPGSVGVCTNIPSGTEDNEAMVVCNGTQACDGTGTCKLKNGQTCTSGTQCISTKCIGGNPKTCQP